jgi:hypothetical protein
MSSGVKKMSNVVLENGGVRFEVPYINCIGNEIWLDFPKWRSGADIQTRCAFFQFPLRNYSNMNPYTHH